MDFTVIVPYRYTDSYRHRACEWVLDWWSNRGIATLVGECDGDWSKGAAVDSVRSQVETEGLIIADCDVVISRELLGISKAAVRGGAPWAMPHGRVIRLSRGESARIYRVGDTALSSARDSRWAPPGGGVVILTTDAYDMVGGIDPRFVGWGGEDISFARALDTLVGLGVRFGGILWHLSHPRTARRPGNRASIESERLAGLYLDAEGNPSAMRTLIAQHRSTYDEEFGITVGGPACEHPSSYGDVCDACGAAT